MFNRWWKKEPTGLELEIKNVYERMHVVGPNDEEYSVLLKHIQKLEKLQTHKQESKLRLSPDTVLLVVGNLIGIGIVVNYERIHVWTTRSMNVAPPLPNPKI